MQRSSVLNQLQQPSFNNSLKSSLAAQGEHHLLHCETYIQPVVLAGFSV